jgi:hypothetical protein
MKGVLNGINTEATNLPWNYCLLSCHCKMPLLLPVILLGQTDYPEYHQAV